MNISTEFIYPPIPDRRYDWAAWITEERDEEDRVTGWGRTEQDAIEDLKTRLDEL